jgi:uncharacterized protein (TIGR02147 family)
VGALVDIFAYADYRQFCRDFYEHQKERGRGFSYRSFARKAKVAPAYLKHIIDGKRNLSPAMSLKFGLGMGLNQNELEYFENLVRFNQAQTIEEKSLYFENLRRKRAKTLVPLGMTEAASLLSHWYVVAIKELVVNLNSIDSELIQKALRKRIPKDLIEKSVENLQRLGWLHLDDGRWISKASQIQFPDEIKSFVIRSFHSQMLQLAQESLEDALDQREFGAAVFTIPQNRIAELKVKVKELQRELIGFVQDVAKDEKREDHRVYYLGVQCFALEKREGD